jgi:hypothetical protein
MIMDTEYKYRVFFTKENFEKIRQDPDFPFVLTLMRTINTLHFVFHSVIGDDVNEENPSTKRNLINSFLFSSSILFESLLLLDRCGIYFRDYNAFKEKVVPFRSRVCHFKDTILNSLRNEFVFHFDEDYYKQMLESMIIDDEKIDYIVSKDGSFLETYYILPDSIALNSVIKGKMSKMETIEKMITILTQTREYINEYTDVVHSLIDEKIERGGFSVYSVSPSGAKLD